MQVDQTTYEYLQIDFDRVQRITAVETQGRYGGGNGREYSTQYMIDYWRRSIVDGDVDEWRRYHNRRGDVVSWIVFFLNVRIQDLLIIKNIFTF